ncbi:MAG TPA: HAD-IIB family hydrolase, partial [Gemmatimonadota bacterium]|nr:HAD-IIB family hydrolase [Gemmatimonadota bacterium]
MIPLERMDAAACRSLAGVAFDIDDTVTRGGRLEAAAFGAMYELAESGLRLVAVTGRPLGWIDVVVHHWPVDVGVGENGAGWVWRDGAATREGYFESEARRRTYPELFDRVRRHVASELPHVRTAGDQRARRCDLAFDVGETVKLPSAEIDVLVGIIESEGARSAVSSVHAHAIPGDWDKARGLQRAVRETLGQELDRDRWLFVGDSSNDAAAFEYFPLSVGVSNVRDHLSRLPTPPRYVTAADRGQGFAELARHVLS